MKKNSILTAAICAVMALASASAFAEEALVGVPQISVDGDVIDLSKYGLSQYLFEENGAAMVPVRAVAEKMGFTVGWDAENQAITVGSSDWEARAYIGEDLYSGVTKIEGAVGMTAPQSYGTAPVLIEDRTYVPAKMFELMGYGYRAIGQFVDFRKVGTIKDKDGQEYSNDTLILSVKPEAEIDKLLEENGLEIVYKMDTLNMYALRLPYPMTAEEMDAYIAELEKNENILAVNRDYMVQLDDGAQIPNPFVPYESLDAAKKALSFTPSVPGYVPEGYQIDEITVVEDSLLQIIYRNGSDETIYYRTAVGDENISGDYNVYASTKTIKVGDLEVTERGNEKVTGAVWSTGGFTYSIQSDRELSENEVIEMIQSLS